MRDHSFQLLGASDDTADLGQREWKREKGGGAGYIVVPYKLRMLAQPVDPAFELSRSGDRWPAGVVIAAGHDVALETHLSRHP